MASNLASKLVELCTNNDTQVYFNFIKIEFIIKQLDLYEDQGEDSDFLFLSRQRYLNIEFPHKLLFMNKWIGGDRWGIRIDSTKTKSPYLVGPINSFVNWFINNLTWV